MIPRISFLFESVWGSVLCEVDWLHVASRTTTFLKASPKTQATRFIPTEGKNLVNQLTAVQLPIKKQKQNLCNFLKYLGFLMFLENLTQTGANLTFIH